MNLFLHHDLVKADLPAGGAPTPPAAPTATPDMGNTTGGPAEGMQPCSVGGGDMCLRAGGNGNETHKIGGAIERRHAEFKASSGAGAPQVETAQDATQSSPEQVQQAQIDAAASQTQLDPNRTQGVTSTNPEDYPADTHPMDHYRVADSIEKLGNGNDSAKELAMAHRKIAQQRAESMSPQDHQDIADQLRQMGAHEHATHHDKVVEDHVAMTEARDAAANMGDEVAAAAEQRNEDVKQKVRGALDEQKAKIAADEKAAEPVRDAAANMGDQLEQKKQKAEKDPYQQALQDHETHKQEVDQQHADSMREHADMTRELKDHTKKTTKLEEKVRAHKKKDPGTFGKKISDFASGDAYSAAKNKHLEAKQKHKDELKKLQDELADHKAAKPENPGKPPKHPGYDDEPNPEDFGGKVPETAKEKAAHQDHVGRAQQISENVQSHLDGNEELSDSDRKKLESVIEALGEHAGHDKTPTKDHSKDLKELEKLAGAHGKEGFQSDEEEVAPPETPMDELRADAHKQSAKDLHDNLQSHIDQMEAAGNAEGAERLRKIQEQAQTHIENDMMPGSEEEAHLKELTKMAGEHGKPPKETASEDGKSSDGKKTAESGKTSSAQGHKRNWRHDFGRGREVGSRLGRAAGSAEGAGEIASTTLNTAAGGVVVAGEDLLHKPHRARAERKAEKEAEKERQDQQKQESEAEVTKGLYLDLDAGMDLIKAVQSTPNTSVSVDSGKDAQRGMKASYGKNPTGVMGSAGIAMPDDPDVGRQWKHDPEDSVEEEIEDEQETKKSGSAILKSILTAVEPVVAQRRYSPTEIEYLRDVLGYDEISISKGLAKISGRERDDFQDWLQARLTKSLTALGGARG